MSSPARTFARPARVEVSPSADILQRIGDVDTVATVWRRSLDERITRDLGARLPHRTFENGLLVWSHDYQRSPLEVLVRGLEASDGRDMLVDDIRNLLDRWFESASVEHAYVSLGVIADPGCRKLHVDRVDRRLLSTYVGAATEWLDPKASDAWRRDKCCWDPNHLHRLGTGDVVLMKGCTSDDEGGLVHRAPPWEPHHTPRLLFRICDGEYHLRRGV